MITTIKKEQKITSVVEEVHKSERMCPVDWNGKWSSHHGKKYGNSSRNYQEDVIMYPSNLTSGNVPQYLKSRFSQSCLSTHVHGSTICNDKRWKLFKYPWTDEWISKMWYLYLREYY